ncbi:MAG TPA: His/Gly/Thr/Pro-type tRNA ligase C-terminal domain-containing protein, partial [Desulfobaccales bacterium]|nr:His/Gly/Thr/Pro-type tRNA ligase C-terminal domain-containing protein [Desulfobaccales bacterium]
PQDFGQDQRKSVFVAALGEAARERAFILVQELRRKDLAAEMDFEGRSLKAQMSLADRLKAAYVVILGERELAAGQAQVRPMGRTSHHSEDAADLTEVQGGRLAVEQEQVRFEDLVDYLTGKIKQPDKS